MLTALFHAWERRLASVTTDRIVRPFDWGLDWISANGNGGPGRKKREGPVGQLQAWGGPGRKHGQAPVGQLQQWVAHVMADTDAFFTPPPTREYTLSDRLQDGERR